MAFICGWLGVLRRNYSNTCEVRNPQYGFHRGNGGAHDRRADHVHDDGADSGFRRDNNRDQRKDLAVPHALWTCHGCFLAVLFPGASGGGREQGRAGG